MKHWLIFSLLFVALSSFSLSMTDDSFAARMGGGRSFGSQPTMRTPTVAPRPAQPVQPYRAPQQAQPMRPASSGMGAMGGLFGGLLAGTMLGSLLGGGGGAGMAGAGGGGIGFIDILLFGAIIWFGLRFFRRMRQANQDPQAEPNSPYSQTYSYSDQQSQYQNQGGTAWDRLRNATQPQTAGFGAPDVPAGFDVEEFLQGAKAAYVRMQSSWSQRDLNDIALFATPSVMQELQQQMAQDPNPCETELVSINLQLVNVTTEGNIQRAQVLFDVLMREDPSQVRPEPVKEIWHFVRSLPDGTWKLDGIQQAY